MKRVIAKKYLAHTITYIIVIFVTSLIIYQLQMYRDDHKRLSQKQVLQEAKALFQSIVDARFWNAQYGGVYVKAHVDMKPNPYLKENTLLSDKNETLIKINPAWMTRQISGIANKVGNYKYKITSLKPINPTNKADEFETEALQYFEKNKQNKYYYKFDEPNNKFDFMGALVVKKACLGCHAFQGYKLGDIRGGIRVSIPAQLYKNEIILLNEKTNKGIFYVFLGAGIILVLLTWMHNMFYRRQYEVEHMNEILEKRVYDKTKSLELIVKHDQHLKDALKVITEVNEILMASYSAHSILENSVNKLYHNSAYSHVLAGLINENIFEVISESTLFKSKFSDKIILLNEQKDSNFLLLNINKVIELKHYMVAQVPFDIQSQNREGRRESDEKCKWYIVLPLLSKSEKTQSSVYGVIVVFSSREDGFSADEISILENMANDIGIALHSHKQSDALMKMEQDKVVNYEETILALVNIIEQRDSYTAGHTLRVAHYCSLIAKKMAFSEVEVNRLEKAAILHDIGKVATPDSILLKPGKLSYSEYELIKQHSDIGADMLEHIAIYKDLANIIRYHHSRYDGSGYPKTSNPNDIPMLSHIMILADAFDAMVSNRIYKPRKTKEDALVELSNLSSKQFHPLVVEAAVEVLKDIEIEYTSQLPQSELEQRRMSYFFRDALTGAYNEDYLKLIINTSAESYQCLNIVNLHNFSKYNQTNGWQAGNTLLKEFATFLQELYPDSLVIRYHGDDFVLLSMEYIDIDILKILEFEPFKGTKIKVDLTHYKIDKSFTFESLEN